MGSLRDERFGALLRRLRKERGLSQERLAYAMWNENSDAPTPGAIGHFERGVARPTLETVELIARALDVPADRFAEYRLAQARRQFDERQVGLERALENLSYLEAAFGGVDVTGPLAAAEEFRQAVEEGRHGRPPEPAKRPRSTAAKKQKPAGRRSSKRASS